MKIEELVSGKSEFIKGVYKLGGGEFSYSDGNSAEKYIYDVLKSATDISSQSSELEGKIVDWSSRYHFSSSRANCYRAVNFKAGARILEIGSGCGSITRYLGETGLEVIALEGSPRRAEITRIRTRDLANVTVICGSFSEVQFKTNFDYVICNGVLEYAPLFVNAEDPSDAFIKRVFELLSADGVLLLAIENKLGLRYFAGGKEEHTGILYDGLEDYPRFPNGAKTHSKSELRKIIGKYFRKIDLLLPLPDYKFPKAIIRSELTSMINCGEMFGAMEDYTFPTMTRPNFHQRLTWHSIAEAGLLSEMSNSHFLIAQNQLNDVLSKDWQGEIFKRGHLNQTFKSSQIVSSQVDGKEILGVQERLSSSGTSQTLTPWIDGRSLHSKIASAMLRKRENFFDAPDIQKLLGAWWESIARGADGRILSRNVDAIWRNSICSEYGITLIDQESELSAPISGVHLIYRSVLNFVHDEIPFEHRWVVNNRFLSEYRIVSLVGKSIGVKISIKELVMSVRNEILMQSNLGYGRAGYLKRCLRLFMPIVVIRHIYDVKSAIKKFTNRIKNRFFP